ncbi:MAG: hypothetical protein IME93_00790 [Proteobacteria bacterium]|nr:hypothetical protein [Pseudomonadota bacterium]
MHKYLIISGLLLYPLLTHALIVVDAERYALMALVGLSALGLISQWLKNKAIVLTGVELYLLVLVLGGLNLFTRSAQALSVPFIVVNFMLGVFVLRSLGKDSVSMFERLLDIVHEGTAVPEQVHTYACLFTRIWGWYFISVAATSMLLAVFAPLDWWSWFSNIGYFIITPIVILVMHIYQVRIFGRHGLAMHWRDFAFLLKMPLSDSRHPLRGFRRS